MRLGKIIADYRFANGLSVRATAIEINVPPSSLNRFEHEGVCDGRTLIKIMHWMFGDENPNKETRRTRHASKGTV